MNIFQLTCFLTVAETLNFARAAEHLHVTQPAVTQQIHSLEKELNVKLFKRSTRMVRLTPEGLVFMGDARHMVEISERAKKRFENPSNREIQLLSLGCYSYAQLFLLPPVFQKLKKQYPKIHPRLQVVPFQYLYRLLEEDDVDAIIGFRESDIKKINAIYKEITKVPLVCVSSPLNPLSQQASIMLEELKKEKLVLWNPAKAQTNVAQLQIQLMEGRSPTDFYFCESAEAAAILAQADFGISILPSLLVPPSSLITCIPIEDAAPVSFGIYYKSLQGNAPLKSLIQHMKEQNEKGNMSANTNLPT